MGRKKPILPNQWIKSIQFVCLFFTGYNFAMQKIQKSAKRVVMAKIVKGRQIC